MRQALGRGLEALIPAAEKDTEIGEKAATHAEGRVIKNISISKIRPNRLQPRREFAPESLDALAASIKAHGLAQPILVSQAEGTDSFELIAGERRLRASQLAGLSEIDAIVRPDVTDSERLSLSLIENLQREDLNPIESALGLKRLISEFGMTQVQVSESVGKSRSAVANTLRLLDLEPEIQASIREGVLTEGHGRALLSVEASPRRRELWQKAIAEGWTVRRLERAASETDHPKKEAAEKEKLPPEVRSLQTSLQQFFGTKVALKVSPKGKGVVRIHFYSLNDFDRLLAIFKKAGLS